MNRKTTTASKTQLLRAAFFLALLFLVIQLMPRVVGQRRTPEALAAICPWQLVANMPLDLYGAAGASNGTYSYHAGGYSFSSFPSTVNVFNRYDPGHTVPGQLPLLECRGGDGIDAIDFSLSRNLRAPCWAGSGSCRSKPGSVLQCQ